MLAAFPATPVRPLANLRERMGLNAADCSDETVERQYRWAAAMACLQVELMIAKAGIQGWTQH
ncbi:MAG: hypothetical protein Q8O42_09455 [Acidobacteriota bacterium]|nr:hypothetical protein [Acidobacteriota bacterium]